MESFYFVYMSVCPHFIWQQMATIFAKNWPSFYVTEKKNVSYEHLFVSIT